MTKSLLLVATLLLPAIASAQETKWDARIASATGDVAIRPAGGGEESGAEADMPLEEGDTVVVGEGGSAEVALDGGSLITVRENSEFKLEKTDKAESVFSLSLGSILAKIQKLGEQRLKVRTPTAVAAVRGTEFGVEVEGDDSHVGVFDEGKVEVSGAAGGATETLISNQETSVLKGAAPAHAVQLQRFIARRALMRQHARRIATIKARWKALPLDQRRELRAKALERMRENRRKMLEKFKERQKKRQDHKAIRDERQRQKRDEDRRKMEERRRRYRPGRP